MVTGLSLDYIVSAMAKGVKMTEKMPLSKHDLMNEVIDLVVMLSTAYTTDVANINRMLKKYCSNT